MDIHCYKKWLQKRKNTTIAFSLQNFVLGLEDSVIFLTLWLYITNTLNVHQPKLWYAIIASTYHVCSIGITTVIGRWVDKSRYIRKTFLICNLLVIIGNILYSIPLSPVFLILGRAIGSFGAALQPIMSSEMVRSYPLERQSSILSILSGTFTLGFILGPCITLPFQSIRFDLFSLKYTFENTPGIIAAVFFGLMNILCWFLTHDLSLEFDLKSANYVIPSDSSNVCTHNVVVTENISFTNGCIRDQNIFNVIKFMLRNTEFVILLAMNFCGHFLMISYDMWLPLIVFDVFHYRAFELVFATLTQCVITSITLIMIARKQPSDFKLYIGVVFTHVCAILTCITLYLMIAPHNNNYGINLLLLFLFNLFYSFLVATLFAYFTNIIAKMVDSSIQALAESIRMSVSKLAGSLAFITSPFLFSYLNKMCFIVIIFIMLSLFVYIKKRRFYCNPYIVIE